MNGNYIPRLSLEKPSALFQPNLTGHITQTANATNDGGAFKNFITNSVEQINTTLQQPDSLMNRAMTVGDVDVHDVMIANAKAELAVNVTTQVVTKEVQAYDKILQIQI